MPQSSLSSFGGMLRIGEKEYSVKGRTYRKIFEHNAWWISECFCPVIELRRFLLLHPEFNSKDFILMWLKTSRKTMLVNEELHNKISSTFASRKFDIWQACRDDGLQMNELDGFLDGLPLDELSQFFTEADRKMAIANGVDEFSFLATCFGQVPSEPVQGKSVESMIAQLCVRNHTRMDLNLVLDSTPSMMKTLFTDPDQLVDDIEAERVLHKNDKLGQKRLSRVYDSLALNMTEGFRIDHYRPKVNTQKTPIAQKEQEKEPAKKKPKKSK